MCIYYLLLYNKSPQLDIFIVPVGQPSQGMDSLFRVSHSAAKAGASSEGSNGGKTDLLLSLLTWLLSGITSF